jgi:hypothetical protein
LGDKWDRRTATDRRNGGDGRQRNSVALQRVLNHVNEAFERTLDHPLQFGARDPDVGRESRQGHRNRCGGVCGQALLG